MTIIRWIIGTTFLLFGGYMIVMNWGVFINNHVLKKKWTSAVPFVGGVAAAIGLACLPVAGLWRFSWVLLIIDWGSIPVVCVSLICHLKGSSTTNNDA